MKKRCWGRSADTTRESEKGSDPAARLGVVKDGGYLPQVKATSPGDQTRTVCSVPAQLCDELLHSLVERGSHNPVFVIETSRSLEMQDQGSDAEGERRLDLATLEDGLCDLQIMAVELKMETTDALLRMAILDVRQAMGFRKMLDG